MYSELEKDKVLEGTFFFKICHSYFHLYPKCQWTCVIPENMVTFENDSV